MHRTIFSILQNWAAADRKVMLLRGARQVGKTYAVRHLSKSFDSFLEVNFEEEKEVRSLFEGSLDPAGIVRKLANYFGVRITEGRTLLFLDEIQACPDALRSLRFFHEKMPGLHVVACGSLLEFALESIPSHGVGRIMSLFMFPMGFEEFLLAMNEEGLVNEIRGSAVGRPLAPPFHSRLLDHLKTYMVIGGMPEAVKQFTKTESIADCQDVLSDLLRTLRDDFAKYRKRCPASRLNDVLESVVFQAGGKFKYAKACQDTRTDSIKSALDLLVMAGLTYRIHHSDARGFPLGAQVNTKRFKTVVFDVGVHQRILGLDVAPMQVTRDFGVVNRGAVAEVFAAQELRAGSNPRDPRQIYYWHREAKNSNAEVDYVVQHSAEILPIEVKAGGSGRMQSMRMFMKERDIKRGIRTSLENFGSIQGIEIIPLYALASHLVLTTR